MDYNIEALINATVIAELLIEKRVLTTEEINEKKKAVSEWVEKKITEDFNNALKEHFEKHGVKLDK